METKRSAFKMRIRNKKNCLKRFKKKNQEKKRIKKHLTKSLIHLSDLKETSTQLAELFHYFKNGVCNFLIYEI